LVNLNLIGVKAELFRTKIFNPQHQSIRAGWYFTRKNFLSADTDFSKSTTRFNRIMKNFNTIA